jgi:hypothetical protein
MLNLHFLVIFALHASCIISFFCCIFSRLHSVWDKINKAIFIKFSIAFYPLFQFFKVLLAIAVMLQIVF